MLLCHFCLRRTVFSSFINHFFSAGVRDFEDIVPFPSERDSLLSSGASSDSSDLICSLDDHVCTYGTCDKQQRRKCAGIVRSYNIQTASIPMDEPDVKVSEGFNKSASDPYQTGKVLVLIICSQVSMILVGYIIIHVFMLIELNIILSYIIVAWNSKFI